MRDRFLNNVVYAHWSFCDLMRMRSVAQNVGFVGHQHRNPMMFEKWYTIPNKAHRLFWRLHPTAKQQKQ